MNTVIILRRAYLKIKRELAKKESLKILNTEQFRKEFTARLEFVLKSLKGLIVKCDSENNTEDIIKEGKIITHIWWIDTYGSNDTILTWQN
jgi:hypothetical protein